MYIYASLPQQVVIQEGMERVSLTRDALFYLTLGVVSLINVLIFVFSRLYSSHNEPLSIWFFGLIVLLNLFFSTVLGYINVLNSGENFAFENLGVIIYGNISLIIIWAIAWPVYTLSRRFMNKQAV